MQAQRDVGILGGVFGRAVERHFVKADLRGPLATHLFVGDGLQLQHAICQCIHAVIAVGLKHVRLQHRVVLDATQRNAVVGKHVRVVLQMLANLLGRVVLQPDFHAGEHGVARELRRCIQPHHIRPTMGDRDVARLPRSDRQRNADQLRQHRINRGRLGVDADEVGLIEQLHPRFKLRFGGDGLVLDRFRRRFDVEQASLGLLLGKRLASVVLGGCGRFAGSTHAARIRQCLAGRLAQPGLEAVAGEEVDQLALVFAAVNQCIEVRHLFRQIAIELHRQQFAALGQPFERVAQVLADHALDLARAGHDVVERAEFGQPLHSSLRAHLGHARHVVDRVANQ